MTSSISSYAPSPASFKSCFARYLRQRDAMIALTSRDIGDGEVFLHRQYSKRLHNAVLQNCRQGDFGNVITKRVMTN